jgi:hypothetical protein
MVEGARVPELHFTVITACDKVVLPGEHTRDESAHLHVGIEIKVPNTLLVCLADAEGFPVGQRCAQPILTAWSADPTRAPLSRWPLPALCRY